jgi:hypothetical protein
LIKFCRFPNKNTNEENKIVVQKHVGEENEYEQYREVTGDNSVKKVKDILNGIRWQNTEVNMAYPPHYKFIFKNKNEQSNSDKLMFIYHLWISPDNEKVELVIESDSKYIQLNKGDSAELFEIISGEELSNIK